MVYPGFPMLSSVVPSQVLVVVGTCIQHIWVSIINKDRIVKYNPENEEFEEIIFSGPTGLPSDMGEREMLLINAMESALQEGHSREYQNMMKQYFRRLQKGEETLSE